MKTFDYVFSSIIFVVFAGLYGAACWFDYGLWAIAVWVAMIAVIPLASLLHELGHMLFGAICGVKTKPHFSLLGSSNCELIPKKQNKLKTRITFTAMGGIIVNIFLGLITVWLIGFEVMPLCCSFLIPANAYLAALNVIPARLPAGKTDGYVVNGLINNTDEGTVMLAVLTVQAQVLNGKHIEEVDENLLFDLPVIQEDDPAFISLTELRYEYCKAKGDIEQAEKHRTRLEQLKNEYMN